MDERPADQQAFFHPAGKGAVLDVTFFDQLKAFEQFIRALRGFPGRDPEIARLVNQQLVDRQEWIKIEFLRAQADEPARAGVFRGRVITEGLDLAVLKIGEPGHDVNGGGLPGAVGAEEGEKIAALDLQRNIVQRAQFTVIFGEAFDRNGVFRITHCESLPLYPEIFVLQTPLGLCGRRYARSREARDGCRSCSADHPANPLCS